MSSDPKLARHTSIFLIIVANTWFIDVTGADQPPTHKDGFYAFYTKVQSGQPFERFCRTGDYADVVVNVGQAAGRVVFWRGQSYLPSWQTASGRWSFPEVVARRGDGDGRMPDRVNSFSHVQIIQQQPDRVLVHWRYLPKFGGTNPHTDVDATKFVEELFLITDDGQVTRTIRQGTKRLEDWNDARNRTTQQLRLTVSGLELVKQTNASKSAAKTVVQGNPVQHKLAASPSRYWRFDEGVGDTTVESATGGRCNVVGHKTLWKQGVSGTAIQFDGYNTLLQLPASEAPKIDNALTLEGWIAIAAYPWNWAPVVHQGDDEGYFLGIDGHGRPGLKVKVDDRQLELVANEQLQRNRWYHVAGTFDGTTGQARLFLDGQPVSTSTMARGSISAPEVPVQIGKGKQRRPVDPVRANTFIDSYSFDGLIDEVRIHSTALSPKLIANSYELLRPKDSVINQPDMDYRLLPQPDTGGEFGARYTHLKFYDSWDVLWRFGSYPDVVVGFDSQPTQFVFWRGTGFIPMLVNEKQQWYSNEFNETWGRTGGQGCQEPMSDKEAYTNHVRVLEDTDARVVVHWRYPLLDVLHVSANYDKRTGWCDYSDWYYYIYPDGVAVKRMQLWTHGPRNHEWQESMAILGPNQHPEQVINTNPALVLADLNGNATAYQWAGGPPEDVDYTDQKIHLVKYKADYSPFTIGDFTGGDVYGGEVTDYSVFPSWNHWPVAQMPSDGRYASYPDRTAHSSLTHVRLPDYRADHGDRPFQEKVLMEGMTNKSVAELAALAKSWLRAPELKVVGGCRNGGFEQAERSYKLVAADGTMTFHILASRERPLLNPCFEISDWSCHSPATLAIDGEARPLGSSHRQGIVYDQDGRQKMLIWVELEATSPISFTIGGAEPGLAASPAAQIDWAQEPEAVDSALEITMAVTAPSDGKLTEYLFQRTSEDGARLDSGWVTSASYTDRQLLPKSNYRYRVKARNRYLQETEWTPTKSVRTGNMPAPVVWRMAEGKGKRIIDASGRHAGRVKGKADWVTDGRRSSLRFDGQTSVILHDPNDFPTSDDFTWAAWIKSRRGGTIVARAGRSDEWEEGGKVFFMEKGHLKFDVGWVGVVESDDTPLDDGRWHHVAVTVHGADETSNVTIYADGLRVGEGRLEVTRFPESQLPLMIGYCNDDFPDGQTGFAGQIRDVRWYGYGLTDAMIAQLMTVQSE